MSPAKISNLFTQAPAVLEKCKSTLDLFDYSKDAYVPLWSFASNQAKVIQDFHDLAEVDDSIKSIDSDLVSGMDYTPDVFRHTTKKRSEFDAKYKKVVN